MKHKYYYTYKVQCTAVGWEDYYYLGKHVTSNLNDGYKGSGKKLQEYYKQYPEDYTFIILEFYSNKTELNIAEQKLIGDLWKTDPYCLNSNAGGAGSWKCASQSHVGKPSWNKGKKELQQAWNKGLHGCISEETRSKISESSKNRKHSEETKRKMSESRKGEGNAMYGKHHNEESKQKMSKIHKGKTTWNKGVPMSDVAKQKLSKTNKGRFKGKHWKIDEVTGKRIWY